MVRPEDLVLDPLSEEFLAHQSEPMPQRNIETLTKQIAKGEGTQGRKLRLYFLVSPVEMLGTDRVEGVRIEQNVLVKDGQGNLKAKGLASIRTSPVR